jgi:hypothetical protein
MKTLRNEEGVALAMVLVLSAISLAAMAAMMYMMTVRTQMSGLQKRYSTAYEAAMGGADIAKSLIPFKLNTPGAVNLCQKLASQEIPGGDCEIPDKPLCVPNTVPAGCAANEKECGAAGCTGLKTKLNLMTDCWTGCDSDITINPEDNTTYDIRFRLDNGLTEANQDYKAYYVHLKIVDTTYGNTSPSGEVEKAPCVTCPDPVPTIQIVYLYTIEVLSVRYDPVDDKIFNDERARTSLLYIY